MPTATGKQRSYLEPISQTMQKTRRRVGTERTERETLPSYLELIRNSMQKKGRGVGEIVLVRKYEGVGSPLAVFSAINMLKKQMD